MVKAFREGLGELEFAPPRRPPWLAYLGIPVEHFVEVGEFDVPVVCDGLEGLPYFSRSKSALASDHEYVTEVSPSGVRRAPLQCGHDLLGEHHLHRVAAELDRFLSEQAGQGNLGRFRQDRVADADIYMKWLPCTRQSRRPPDPPPAVLIPIADCFGGYIVQAWLRIYPSSSSYYIRQAWPLRVASVRRMSIPCTRWPHIDVE